MLLLDTILINVKRLNGHFDQDSCQDGDLSKLSSECKKIALELRSVIETLRADKKHSSWSSFHAALNHVSKNGKLESITASLRKIQLQIAQHVLFGSRYDHFARAPKKLCSLHYQYKEIENLEIGEYRAYYVFSGYVSCHRAQGCDLS